MSVILPKKRFFVPKSPPEYEEYFIARKRMLREQLIARGIRDAAVLRAMLKVPRHLFVEEALHSMAYNDHPISLGHGQTISQPYIVARMLEALQLTPRHCVLEVGTGCGYQTAVLAELVQHVYSIERIPELVLRARKTLKRLHYKNITLKLGDGTLGWPEQAPFDAIIVSAASPQIPQPFLKQMIRGGKMILPLGDAALQQLMLATERAGQWETQTLAGCRFVKLKGRHGFAAS